MDEYLPQCIKAIIYTRIGRMSIRLLVDCFPEGFSKNMLCSIACISTYVYIYGVGITYQTMQIMVRL